MAGEADTPRPTYLRKQKEFNGEIQLKGHRESRHNNKQKKKKKTNVQNVRKLSNKNKNALLKEIKSGKRRRENGK